MFFSIGYYDVSLENAFGRVNRGKFWDILDKRE
jgi:hypothetical protein